MKAGTERNTDMFHSFPLCKALTLIFIAFSPVALHPSKHARRRMDDFCSICKRGPAQQKANHILKRDLSYSHGRICSLCTTGQLIISQLATKTSTSLTLIYSSPCWWSPGGVDRIPGNCRKVCTVYVTAYTYKCTLN